jgi:hypothetical protein
MSDRSKTVKLLGSWLISDSVIMMYDHRTRRKTGAFQFGDAGASFVSPIHSHRSAASALLLVHSNQKEPMRDNRVFDQEGTPSRKV